MAAEVMEINNFTVSLENQGYLLAEAEGAA
jgi:hypothetical protein